MPNRPSRVAGFSYIGPYQYFLTICCDRRRRWFEDRDAANWLASQIGQLFASKHFAVIAYCVMPDHVHLLVEGLAADADLRSAVHAWKQSTGFVWKGRSRHRLWQTGYYDYVLRDENLVPAIVKYIIGNPVRAGLGDDAGAYPHTGSSRYRMDELNDCVSDWRPAGRRRV